MEVPVSPRHSSPTCGTRFCSMKITQVMRDDAQAHRFERAADALAEGMREKPAEFVQARAEIQREV